MISHKGTIYGLTENEVKVVEGERTLKKPERFYGYATIIALWVNCWTKGILTNQDVEGWVS
jgi:hypothetical protein